MKKVILFALFALSGLTRVQGQNNSLGHSDPDAKKILDAVSRKVSSYKAIQATFSLRIEDAQGAVQGNKKGSMQAKGNKYKISITGQEIFCDGTTIWTYDKSSNEVTITKFDPATNNVTPRDLLTNFYDKDFLYKLNGEQKMGTKTVQEIEMTPMDKTKNFHKIYVYIDKSQSLLYSLKMLDNNGNRYIYTINTLNGNAALSDQAFVFDKTKYPGVEEVDLRE